MKNITALLFTFILFISIHIQNSNAQWHPNTVQAVDSVSPKKNKLNVPLISNIKTYFNQDINPLTIDSSTIIFFGSMTGRKSAAYTYNSGEKSITIDPNFNFKYGELISTTLDSGIKISSGTAITPFEWSFMSMAKSSNLVFNQISSIPVGPIPNSLAVGDFNGDGNIDLATANSGGSGGVSILINNGKGTFTKQNPDITTGNNRSIVAGDFDNDGDLDLAVTAVNLNALLILTNNGSGVFTVTASIPVGSACWHLTCYDFDGDGFLDFAVCRQTTPPGNLLIVKNLGNGNFTISQSIDAPNMPYEITPGDFDSDGLPDIAVPIYYSNSVYIYKNNGNGTFSYLSSAGVGANPQGVTTGDFDNDGDLDLAVTNFSSNTFTVLKNNGSGVISSTQTVNVGTQPWGINCADMDGDSDLDLVVCSGSLPALYSNNGSGTFTFSSSLGTPSGGAPHTISADFNNDGVLDIATANNSSTVNIIINLTSPILLSPANNSIGNLNSINFSWTKSPGASNFRIQIATDSLFNNLVVNDSTLLGTDSVKSVSGLIDLTGYYWRMNSKSTNGTSLWSETWKFKTQGTPTQVNLISPLNNSIAQPLNISFVWSKAYDQTFSLNKSIQNIKSKLLISKYWMEYSVDSNFSASVMIDSTLTDTLKFVSGLNKLTKYYWHVKAKNESGWGSFSSIWNFTTTYFIDSVSPGQNKINVPLTSNLKAYFHQSMNNSTIDSNSVTFFGSMTGRKRGALSYNSGNNSLQIAPNSSFKYGELISTTLDSGIKTGSGNSIAPFVWSFTSMAKPSNLVFNQMSPVNAGTNPHSIVAGDFNNDGFIDLAVMNSGSNNVSILINNGNGAFTKLNSDVGVGNAPTFMIEGDFDGDGYLDLAVTNFNSNTISILKNNGTGVFTVSSSPGVLYAPYEIATGDFDGDGFLDLAVTYANSNTISILKNNGTGVFTITSTVGAGGYSNRGIITGDFDGDGDLDLAVCNANSAIVTILKNDGTGVFSISSSVGGGTYIYEIATGDFDGDGYLDLAITDYFSSVVSILKNNGTGNFSLISSIGGLSNPYGLTAGDFDGDGDLDLAVAGTGSSTIKILKNNGTATFTLSSSIGVGSNPVYLTTGDLNNDGVLDLAVSNLNSNNVSILINLIPPSLISPANNSTGNINTLNFTWQKSLGAGNYRFQLATDSLFTNLLVNDSTLLGTDSIKSVSGLNGLSWYYWRMNSKSSNGTSLWSDMWKFKTEGSPTTVNLFSPANNSINQPVNLTFTWFKAIDQVFNKINLNKKGNKNAGPENVSVYWFDLSTDSTFTSIIVRDSTLSDTSKYVSGLNNFTNYYWRVRARNEIGWGLFSSIWKFTTIVPFPLAPVLTAPPTGSINISRTPTLSWNDVQYAASYRIQIASAAQDTLNFTTTTWDTSGVTVAQLTIPAGKLAYNTKYYWRVNATNIAGTGPWASSFNFRTITDPTALTMSNFTSILCPRFMSSGTATRLPVAIRGTIQGLVPNKTYRYYNMMAISTDIGTTAAGAGILMLINNTTGTFTYSSLGSLTTSGQYETFVANSSGSFTGWFGSLNSGNVRFTAGNYVYPTIVLGDSVGTLLARYAMSDSIQVLAFSASSGATNGTGVYGISLGIPKNFVALYNNVNGTGKPLSTSWIEAQGNTLPSVVQFYFDSVNAYNGRWGSIIPNTLPTGVQRVEQRSLNGTLLSFNSNASGIWPSGANTVNPAGGTAAIRLPLYDVPLLNPPVMLTPINGTLDLSTTPTLTWNISNVAANYRVQINSDSTFVAVNAYDSTGITALTITIPFGKLTTNTKYFWRLCAVNMLGASLWSVPWNFSTSPNLPNSPVLALPANGAINQPLNITFSWYKAIETLFSRVERNIKTAKGNSENGDKLTLNKYCFDLVTDTSSLANLLRDTTLTDTTKTVNGLNYLTNYYWRVKAKNQIGWGNYSVWFKFTTIPLPAALVNLTVIPGGFYDQNSGLLFMKDSVRVFLVDSVTSSIVDSARAIIDSISFSAQLSFTHANTGSYYIFVFHRNHIPVASTYQTTVTRGSTVSYNFTDAASKTFGNNVIQVSTSPARWGMIPGDANQDQYIDGLDQTIWIGQNGLGGFSG